MDPEEASTRSESFFEIKTDLALVGNGNCIVTATNANHQNLFFTEFNLKLQPEI